MTSPRWTITTITITFYIAELVGCSNHSNLIISTIEKLAAREPGVPELVLYELALKKRFEGIFGDILRSSTLKLIPRYVIDRKIMLKYGEIPSEPLILLINAKDVPYNDNSILQTLRAFNPNTKVVVVTKLETRNYAYIKRILELLSFYKVTFLNCGPQNNNQLLASNVESLFYNYIRRKMDGKPIRYSSRDELEPLRTELRWIQETAIYLNTTLQQSNHSCSASHYELQDECYFYQFESNNVDIDCSTYSMLTLDASNFYCLLSNVPAVKVIVVPRLQRNVVELLLLPFNFEVWILLVVIFTAVEVLAFLRPTYFQNDPILLSICGFERRSLHQVNLRERTILITLILLMFIMSCAYEAKLLSMLVYRPVRPKINSLQSLVKSGIKIKTNTLLCPDNIRDNILEGIVTASNVTMFGIDMEHAYIFDKEISKVIISMYYDPKKRIQRYSVMDETLGSYVTAYVLSPRSPLMDAFRHTHNTFVESGIWNVWESKFLFHNITAYNFITDEILSFWDMVPAWLAFGFGCALSLLALLYEFIFVYLFKKNVSKTKQQSTSKSEWKAF